MTDWPASRQARATRQIEDADARAHLLRRAASADFSTSTSTSQKFLRNRLWIARPLAFGHVRKHLCQLLADHVLAMPRDVIGEKVEKSGKSRTAPTWAGAKAV